MFFRSGTTYTRITGKSLKNALIEDKGYNEEDIPSENTLINMLNRMDTTLNES